MTVRTTIDIDDKLLAEARRLSRVRGKSALVRAGLQALVEREAARRLAALGGTDRKLRLAPRRRMSLPE